VRIKVAYINESIIKGLVLMDDNRIIKLYFMRDENALKETENKYGAYCRYIADNILCSYEDSRECTNDALIEVWNRIPPDKPHSLKSYIGCITRHIALNRIKAMKAIKRGGGSITETLDELKECVSDCSVEHELDTKEMKKCIDGFLKGLDVKSRKIFVKRYWYLCSSAQISREMGMTENAVNVMLHRLRSRLKTYLEGEGFEL